MERALEKLARQLMAFDEASLNSLWEKYAAIVQHFEPTKRWEEACVIFGLIQAVRFKNQLFNYHWKQSSSPVDLTDSLSLLGSRPPSRRARPVNQRTESTESRRGRQARQVAALPAARG